ncbi:endopeptidase La, partial [Bradyrhizobium sp.]|uniref:endopeptidase La n=1 Tax=Bradyrhizobium sp. TaxID=376 RepID=UPI003C74C327
TRELDVLELGSKIQSDVRGEIDKSQREYFLRQQMRAIQQELGETDEQEAEVNEIRQKIEELALPEEADKAARRELDRLSNISPQSAEYPVIRTYLDWIITLPLNHSSEDNLDVAHAREILDRDHYDLEKVKDRILEFLAVRKLKADLHGPILCFVGPPGVGKTSLGQSIARAMERPFVRVSLGGVHDEAEIRGHRRTYIGALPGNIIQAIKKAGSRNCVMMLDEIDKMGRGIHGDPSAAMLEVLDPEQNATFRDNYLGVPFDLSRVAFIATANMLDTVPVPLLDRMEIISLAGYTEDEKLEIAQRYLIRRQLEANGLKAEQAEIDADALRMIIKGYTREAGVRNLEREIGKAFRNVAVQVAEGSTSRVVLTTKDIATVLGQPRFENEIAMRTSISGVATGLAWTPVGGDILFIEATRTPGKGSLILTGQLGEVMRESAQAALTLVKSRASQFAIDPLLFEKSDIHVHVPAGATPKDGPSAGVAMFIALASLLTDRTVRSDTAMTGEISLRGLVLPVGGIKEKVVAAAAAGLARVMLPARNRRDFDDIPPGARSRLEFVWLERVDDAIAAALEGNGARPP